MQIDTKSGTILLFDRHSIEKTRSIDNMDDLTRKNFKQQASKAISIQHKPCSDDEMGQEIIGFQPTSNWYVLDPLQDFSFDLCHKSGGILYRFKVSNANIQKKWIEVLNNVIAGIPDVPQRASRFSSGKSHRKSSGKKSD